MHSRRNRYLILSYWALMTINFWSPILVIYLQGRGLSLAQIGALGSAHFAFMLIGSLFAGALADTWGRPLAMQLGAALNALALFGLTSRTTWLFVVAYISWGVSWALAENAAAAMFYDRTQDAHGQGDTGRRESAFVAVKHAASAAGSISGAWMMLHWHREAPFWSAAAAAALAAFLARLIRQPAAKPKPEAMGRFYGQTLKQALRAVGAHPKLRYLILLDAAVGTLGYFLVGILIQPYLAEAGIRIDLLGTIVVAVKLAGVAGASLIERWRERTAEIRLLRRSLSAMAMAAAALWVAPSWIAVMFFILVQVAAAATEAVLLSAESREAPGDLRATIFAFRMLISTIGLTIVQATLMPLADQVGLPATAGLVAMILAILGGTALTMIHHHERQASAAISPPEECQ